MSKKWGLSVMPYYTRAIPERFRSRHNNNKALYYRKIIQRFIITYYILHIITLDNTFFTFFLLSSWLK